MAGARWPRPRSATIRDAGRCRPLERLHERWLRAVAAGGQGHYGMRQRRAGGAATRSRARARWHRWRTARTRRLFGNWVGSLWRAGWDGRAHALAGSDLEASVDALIGLAADALGMVGSRPRRHCSPAPEQHSTRRRGTVGCRCAGNGSRPSWRWPAATAPERSGMRSWPSSWRAGSTVSAAPGEDAGCVRCRAVQRRARQRARATAEEALSVTERPGPHSAAMGRCKHAR